MKDCVKPGLLQIPRETKRKPISIYHNCSNSWKILQFSTKIPVDTPDIFVVIPSHQSI